MQFPHEKLLVYQKSLAFFTELQGCVNSWGRQYAFVDHLSRAAESILYNLVEAARVDGAKKKSLQIDYSLGSGFECAACLDLALIRKLLSEEILINLKKQDLEICRMLIGLRNSWIQSNLVRDDHETYTAGNSQSGSIVFHHEQLDMYTVAGSYYQWFANTTAGGQLTSTLAKSCDVLATSMVLNIAEGNGRYAELSRLNFLDTANAAAVKSAVCLDMGLARNIWNNNEVTHAKSLLVRIGQMTSNR